MRPIGLSSRVGVAGRPWWLLGGSEGRAEVDRGKGLLYDERPDAWNCFGVFARSLGGLTVQGEWIEASGISPRDIPPKGIPHIPKILDVASTIRPASRPA